MANHKSAEKRARQNETRRVRNHSYISTVRTAIKKFRVAAAEGSADEAKTEFVAAQSMLSRAAGKGLIHKNQASRKIARLAAVLAKKA